MGFKRYARSGYRKGRRLYKYARANPQKAMAFAKTALHGIKVLRGLVNSEMFHVDRQITLGSAQNKLVNLTAIPQGDHVQARTGNSILVKSFTANGYMYIDPTQTTNTRVMLAIVKDTQQVADTNPALSDIFVSDVTPNTLLNNGNLGRFKIIWRRQYTLFPASTGLSSRQIKIHKRFQFHTRYNGTNDTDIQKNGLYFVIITSENSKYPVVDFQSRFNYHDN